MIKNKLLVIALCFIEKFSEHGGIIRLSSLSGKLVCFTDGVLSLNSSCVYSFGYNRKFLMNREGECVIFFSIHVYCSFFTHSIYNNHNLMSLFSRDTFYTHLKLVLEVLLIELSSNSKTGVL